ncbi:nitrate ABC transporter substrate-binding protein [Guyparkeria halophila]|uniref:Nitrate ABC transporter substrate-binding protein n=1 Tax=Guyparkeria halophila TaxID=47960 RepID=A0A6I6D4E9_9GAMM|nr:CmpA/NrtA family ABC transporter substrate-binding protein [Guyparkeria halophila]QGT78873.1 nitrate ABC transporter substrate-binding protein [Guyparkeria halophila]
MHPTETLRYQPEKTRLALGFIPLTDCAPLIVARERGLFDKWGLEVELKREVSWANIRDRVIIGELDGAQMLAPMPLACSAGLGSVTKPMLAPFVLSLNGNAITLSASLHRALVEQAGSREDEAVGRALKRHLDRERAEGKPRRTFATVFPYSMHTLQLRLWLAHHGIDPDRDVRIVVIPPPQMVANLDQGHVDGFCVGEPWNTLAVRQGVGRIAITGYEIWNNAPEKVLGVTRDWAAAHPQTLKALMAALHEACAWLDQPANRPEAARLVAHTGLIDVPVDAVAPSLVGRLVPGPDEPAVEQPDFTVFHRYAANYPWWSQAWWMLKRLRTHEQPPGGPGLDTIRLAAEVFDDRPYRELMHDLGKPLPSDQAKSEGIHPGTWRDAGGFTLGADRFLDGQAFDPSARTQHHLHHDGENDATRRGTNPGGVKSRKP